MNSLTTNAPHSDPTGRQTPSTPETWPRWTDGIWSGMTATIAASSALKHSWVMHHPSRTTGMLGASATIPMPREPPRQAADHPGPPHAQRRRGAIAHPAEERISDHGQQGADRGDKRQAGRCRWFPTSESTFKAK